jgi:hypothetical protein
VSSISAIRDASSERRAIRHQRRASPLSLAWVNGTPTFFINGHRLDGSFDFETLVSAIHQARVAAKTA